MKEDEVGAGMNVVGKEINEWRRTYTVGVESSVTKENN